MTEPSENVDLGDIKKDFDVYLNTTLNENTLRRIVDMNDLRTFNRKLVDSLLTNPIEIIPHLQENINLGFVGSFGSNFVTPRSINSSLISKMVCCRGIVTSVSLVRPKIKKSVHFDENAKIFYEKEYRDRTMITNLPPTTTKYPMVHNNTLLRSEYGLSEYFDFQTFILQEMPENAPPGQLPRNIECIVSDDLVDKVKPGDRIDVFGIYRAFCGLGSKEFPTQFKTVLIANNVTFQKTEIKKEVDLEKIKLVAESEIKFKSVAPTIFGHNKIKKALAMQMVGGNEVNLLNGARIRGDINILLIGDPSTAKSQLLRYVLNFMPLSVATTGKGSTGVGLTAAVVLDKETNTKRLEAGAMVLADRGVVCIDEFDKMDEMDRVAIHEVMEQQTVTIAKSGIHTTLNARCSVLAAANYKSETNSLLFLPESLLSRFDLIFNFTDKKDIDLDDKISKHVLNIHRGMINESDAAVSQELFKEYILYAKKLRPILTKEASALLMREYASLRQNKQKRITPRCLETLIRLATANAKLRLSENVTVEDAEEAIEMLKEEKIVKVEKKIEIVKETIKEAQKEENVTKKTILTEERREELLDILWKWKENNLNKECCDVTELISDDVKIDEVVALAESLAADDVIMFSDNKIYFLD